MYFVDCGIRNKSGEKVPGKNPPGKVPPLGKKKH